MLYTHYDAVPVHVWPCAHFAPKEIACRGTGELLLNGAALERLDALREAVGRPLVVSSSYRSAVHNARVGGVPLSRHRLGDAFDILLTFDRELLVTKALELGFGGIGVYKTFTHIDLGPRRNWE